MKNINLIKEVTTNRCKFRLVEETDIDDIYEILSNPSVITNLNMNIHKTKEDTKNLLKDYKTEFEKGTKLPLVILEKDTNAFIGVF